jgi:saccharopine dehydrogenase-like NADP-dependent oxidoreductase
MKAVLVVIGSGQIGQAIARRVGVAKHLLSADARQENATGAAEALGNAGYEVSATTVDASSREAVHALIETGSDFLMDGGVTAASLYGNLAEVRVRQNE